MKKYGVRGDVWQARTNSAWRFYFTMEAETHLLHQIQAHPKKQPPR